MPVASCRDGDDGLEPGAEGRAGPALLRRAAGLRRRGAAPPRRVPAGRGGLQRPAPHALRGREGADPGPGPLPRARARPTGCASRCGPGVEVPPSLANIHAEMETDLGLPRPDHGCLDAWAAQGVLLLNATLTVRARQAASHQKHGLGDLHRCGDPGRRRQARAGGVPAVGRPRPARRRRSSTPAATPSSSRPTPRPSRPTGGSSAASRSAGPTPPSRPPAAPPSTGASHPSPSARADGRSAGHAGSSRARGATLGPSCAAQDRRRRRSAGGSRERGRHHTLVRTGCLTAEVAQARHGPEGTGPGAADRRLAAGLGRAGPVHPRVGVVGPMWSNRRSRATAACLTLEDRVRDRDRAGPW